jgi:hypothetical protein
MIRKPTKSRRQLTDENRELHKRILLLETAIFGLKIPDPDSGNVSPISWQISHIEQAIDTNKQISDLILDHLKLQAKRQPKQWFLEATKKHKES